MVYSRRTSHSSYLVFIILFSSLAFGDCEHAPSVDLRRPGHAMENVPVTNQGSVGICYAHAATQVYDSLLKRSDPTRTLLTGFSSSPLAAILELRTGPSEFQSDPDSVSPISVVEFGNPCSVLNDLLLKGTCDQKLVEGSFDPASYERVGGAKTFTDGILELYQMVQKGPKEKIERRKKLNAAIIERRVREIERLKREEKSKYPEYAEYENRKDEIQELFSRMKYKKTTYTQDDKNKFLENKKENEKDKEKEKYKDKKKNQLIINEDNKFKENDIYNLFISDLKFKLEFKRPEKDDLLDNFKVDIVDNNLKKDYKNIEKFPSQLKIPILDSEFMKKFKILEKFPSIPSLATEEEFVELERSIREKEEANMALRNGALKPLFDRLLEYDQEIIDISEAHHHQDNSSLEPESRERLTYLMGEERERILLAQRRFYRQIKSDLFKEYPEELEAAVSSAEHCPRLAPFKTSFGGLSELMKTSLVLAEHGYQAVKDSVRRLCHDRKMYNRQNTDRPFCSPHHYSGPSQDIGPIDKELDNGPLATPIPITFYANMLNTGRAYTGATINPHVALIIGRRWEGGRCQYLLRNSWGKDCAQYSRDWECEEGNIWVDEEAMKKSMFEYSIVAP